MAAVFVAASLSLAAASSATRSRSRALRCCSARFAVCSAARCAAAHSRYDPGESERPAIAHPLTICHSCLCERTLRGQNGKKSLLENRYPIEECGCAPSPSRTYLLAAAALSDQGADKSYINPSRPAH